MDAISGKMSQGMEKAVDFAGKNPGFTAALLTIAGVGAIVGVTLAQAYGSGGALMTGVTIIGFSVGGVYLISKLVTKLLGIKFEDRKWHKTMTKITGKIPMLIGISVMALAMGLQMGGGASFTVVMISGIGGLSTAIGLYFLHGFLEDKAGHTKWYRYLLVAERIAAAVLVPLLTVGLTAILLSYGPTNSLFWYGLVLSPTVFPMLGLSCKFLAGAGFALEKRVPRKKVTGAEAVEMVKQGKDALKQELLEMAVEATKGKQSTKTDAAILWKKLKEKHGEERAKEQLKAILFEATPEKLKKWERRMSPRLARVGIALELMRKSGDVELQLRAKRWSEECQEVDLDERVLKAFLTAGGGDAV